MNDVKQYSVPVLHLCCAMTDSDIEEQTEELSVLRSIFESECLYIDDDHDSAASRVVTGDFFANVQLKQDDGIELKCKSLSISYWAEC